MMPDWLPVKLIASPPSSRIGHRQQRHRDPLAGGQQHVELAAIRVRRHLLGEREQIVGRIAHRGDDDDDVVPGARVRITRSATCFSSRHVGDARAAVFLTTTDIGSFHEITKPRSLRNRHSKHRLGKPRSSFRGSCFVVSCSCVARVNPRTWPPPARDRSSRRPSAPDTRWRARRAPSLAKT